MRRCAMFLCLLVCILAALLLSLAGCGGGGSSGGGGGGSLGVFVTDSFRDDFDHVWMTVYHVDLVNAAGAQAVFDDPAGRIIDLKTLRDSTGARFSFLGSATPAAGTYTQARVTVGASVDLVPRGSTTAQTAAISSDVARDAQGRPVVDLSLSGAHNLGSGTDDLVVDFDLANFVFSGGVVKPALKEGDKSGLADPNRHEKDHYAGTVAELSGTAPNQLFVLAMDNNSRLPVVTDAATVIFNADASPNPVLANGQRVTVFGSFSIGGRHLDASEVRIESDHGAPQVEVRGAPSAISADAGTFVVTITKASGFMPTHTTVNIATSVSTVFRDALGAIIGPADFFAGLASAPFVVVGGTYDAGSNTIAAAWARLGRGEHEPPAVEAKGAPKNVNADHGTFDIDPITERHGFDPPGNAVHVATTDTTVFKDAQGHTISYADFFAALLNRSAVRVEGRYDAATNTITAAVAQLGEAAEHPNVAARGTPVHINADAGTFDIDPVTDHLGFDPPGSRVSVQTNGATVFKNKDGAVVSRADFFAALPNRVSVRVEGAYDAPTNTITATVAQLGEEQAPHNVSAIGTQTHVSADHRTFDIDPVRESTGFQPPDHRVHVLTTDATVFKNADGALITAAQFYGALPTAHEVRVEGTYDASANTITAAVSQLR